MYIADARVSLLLRQKKAGGLYHTCRLISRNNKRILFLELGVGFNTPVIIKYPFWKMTAQNIRATYACVNFGEAIAPGEIKEQSICINADIAAVLKGLGQTSGTQ